MGRQDNKYREEVIKVVEGFGEVDCVLLACTDLQILIPSHDGTMIFDTMKVFVRATVDEILK